ncbi:hypothetical protein GUITHDRAFT_166940, partial [Guillardia theta CCMP2712]
MISNNKLQVLDFHESCWPIVEGGYKNKQEKCSIIIDKLGMFIMMPSSNSCCKLAMVPSFLPAAHEQRGSYPLLHSNHHVKCQEACEVELATRWKESTTIEKFERKIHHNHHNHHHHRNSSSSGDCSLPDEVSCVKD